MGEERGPAVEWVEVEPGVRVRAGAGGNRLWTGSTVVGNVPGQSSRSSPDGGQRSSWDRWRDTAGEGLASGVGVRPPGVARGIASRSSRARWAIGAAVGVLGVIVLVRALGDVVGLAAPATALAPGGDLGSAAATASAPLREAPQPGGAPVDGGGSGAAAGFDPGGVAVADEVLGELGATDWWDVVGILDARRTAALHALDEQGLEGYAELGSPAWSADIAVLEDLRRRGLTPVGLSTDLIAIEEAPDLTPADPLSVPWAPGDRGGGAPDGGAGVRLVIVDRRSAYTLRDSTGATVVEVPAAEARRWRLTLVPDASGDPEVGWRIGAVDALP